MDVSLCNKLPVEIKIKKSNSIICHIYFVVISVYCINCSLYQYVFCCLINYEGDCTVPFHNHQYRNIPAPDTIKAMLCHIHCRPFPDTSEKYPVWKNKSNHAGIPATVSCSQDKSHNLYFMIMMTSAIIIDREHISR